MTGTDSIMQSCFVQKVIDSCFARILRRNVFRSKSYAVLQLLYIFPIKCTALSQHFKGVYDFFDSLVFSSSVFPVSLYLFISLPFRFLSFQFSSYTEAGMQGIF